MEMQDEIVIFLNILENRHHMTPKEAAEAAVEAHRILMRRESKSSPAPVLQLIPDGT